MGACGLPKRAGAGFGHSGAMDPTIPGEHVPALELLRRAMLPAVPGLLVGVLVVVLLHTLAPVGGDLRPVSATPVPLAVLHGWDARRAAAYAADDLTALRGLYVPDSSAGRSDVRVLRAYLDRGWHLRWLQTQVLTAHTLIERDGLVRLRVSDRLAAGAVLGHGICTRLPSDRASTRTIELRRVDGSWQVAAVRA